MKAVSGIYGIYCVVTGKLLVGSSINCKNRCKTHLNKLKTDKHVNKYLQNAFNKHGEDSFVFWLLEECGEEDLKAKEQWWMNHTKSNQHDYGYNLAAAVRQDTPAEGMSKITKEYWDGLSEEDRAVRFLGKRTEEGRERMRKNALNQWADPEFCKSMPLKVSQTMKKICAEPEIREHRKKISREYWASPEAKLKAKKRMEDRWAKMTPEERARMKKGLGFGRGK